MIDHVAFIGDIHGHLDALNCILSKIERIGVQKAVLLGDYVNKGPDSRGVLDRLLRWESDTLELYPLRGNHETALLRALEEGDVRPLLRMSGAATVRAYLEGPTGPDVSRLLNEVFPRSHKLFLEALPLFFDGDGVEASHEVTRDSEAFQVSAHRYVGRAPEITDSAARIDTGCGSGGLLTAFLWPSRGYFQCTESGVLI